MRSGAITRKRGLSASITAVHIADELAEPCRRSTGGPEPAVSTALRRIGRVVLMRDQRRSPDEAKRNPGFGEGTRITPSRAKARNGSIRATIGLYSAATRVAGSTGSTLAAQNLNSGILPNGSS